MTNQEKRRTLKTLTVTAAGLSAAATTPFAWSTLRQADSEKSCGLMIKHQWATGKKKIVIDNPTDQQIAVDFISPRQMKTANGRAIVELAAPPGKFTIPASSSREFDILARTTSKNDTLKTFWITDLIKNNLEIHSSNPALSNLTPVTVFDHALA